MSAQQRANADPMVCVQRGLAALSDGLRQLHRLISGHCNLRAA